MHKVFQVIGFKQIQLSPASPLQHLKQKSTYRNQFLYTNLGLTQLFGFIQSRNPSLFVNIEIQPTSALNVCLPKLHTSKVFEVQMNIICPLKIILRANLSVCILTFFHVEINIKYNT